MSEYDHLMQKRASQYIAPIAGGLIGAGIGSLLPSDEEEQEVYDQYGRRVRKTSPNGILKAVNVIGGGLMGAGVGYGAKQLWDSLPGDGWEAKMNGIHSRLSGAPQQTQQQPSSEAQAPQQPPVSEAPQRRSPFDKTRSTLDRMMQRTKATYSSAELHKQIGDLYSPRKTMQIPQSTPQQQTSSAVRAPQQQPAAASPQRRTPFDKIRSAMDRTTQRVGATYSSLSPENQQLMLDADALITYGGMTPEDALAAAKNYKPSSTLPSATISGSAINVAANGPLTQENVQPYFDDDFVLRVAEDQMNRAGATSPDRLSVYASIADALAAAWGIQEGTPEYEQLANMAYQAYSRSNVNWE